MGAHMPSTTQLKAHPGPILTTFWPIAHQNFEFRKIWKYVRNRLAETRRMRYVSRGSDSNFLKKKYHKILKLNFGQFSENRLQIDPTIKKYILCWVRKSKISKNVSKHIILIPQHKKMCREMLSGPTERFRNFFEIWKRSNCYPSCFFH